MASAVKIGSPDFVSNVDIFAASIKKNVCGKARANLGKFTFQGGIRMCQGITEVTWEIFTRTK